MDEERRLFVWGHAPTIAGYVLDRLDDARVNPWGDRLPPLIMSESKATAGVLTYAVAADYRCPIAGTKGQSRGFLVTEVAPLLIENDRPVLYLGDSDKSGTDIEANTRRVLERETGRVIEWTRLGMTEQLVEQRGIEPIWKVDGRTKRGHWGVEVESLGQAGVVDLVRAALDALLREPIARVREREERERAEVRGLLDGSAG